MALLGSRAFIWYTTCPYWFFPPLRGGHPPWGVPGGSPPPKKNFTRYKHKLSLHAINQSDRSQIVDNITKHKAIWPFFDHKWPNFDFFNFHWYQGIPLIQSFHLIYNMPILILPFPLGGHPPWGFSRGVAPPGVFQRGSPPPQIFSRCISTN